MKLSQKTISKEGSLSGSIPIEDIGVLIIDNHGVVYTHACMTALLNNNTAVILSGNNHHPAGLLLPLDTNSVQSERFRYQIEASLPLKKQLWQQTVKSKIRNQAGLLKIIGEEHARLLAMIKEVKSDDTGNLEAQASRYYWCRLLGKEFRRDRFGEYPNNLLNYGYMVLRAAVARSLVSSGLLPTLGIHHRNRYNAYCLADDIMEPYRVFVDQIVYKLKKQYEGTISLTKELKKELLNILTGDVQFDDMKSPLIVGLHRTTASLYRCFSEEQKSIDYPSL